MCVEIWCCGTEFDSVESLHIKQSFNYHGRNFAKRRTFSQNSIKQNFLKNYIEKKWSKTILSIKKPNRYRQRHGKTLISLNATLIWHEIDTLNTQTIWLKSTHFLIVYIFWVRRIFCDITQNCTQIGTFHKGNLFHLV